MRFVLSPKKEFKTCLGLQDTIISCIRVAQGEIEFDNIKPGHIEISSEEFWSDAQGYYNAFDSIDFVTEEVFEHYSIRLGSESYMQRLQNNNLFAFT